jgi:DNA-binding XRE family transcriptional regulator
VIYNQFVDRKEIKMYYINLKLPLDKRIKFENQKKTSKEIGINESTLCRILSGKQGTSKVVAYCITKYFNKESEILDYFVNEED